MLLLRAHAVLGATLIALLGGARPSPAGETPPSFGQQINPADTSINYAIPPDGAALPKGHGTAADGQKVFADRCAACHGDKLQGVMAIGAPALIGGRGTLAKPVPVKTVESYWPYATTLFDYVRRAMPFNAPGSLTNDQAYGVVAYILAEGKIIDTSEVIDARSLPRVRMPNAAGFIPDPRR